MPDSNGPSSEHEVTRDLTVDPAAPGPATSRRYLAMEPVNLGVHFLKHVWPADGDLRGHLPEADDLVDAPELRESLDAALDQLRQRAGLPTASWQGILQTCRKDPALSSALEYVAEALVRDFPDAVAAYVAASVEAVQHSAPRPHHCEFLVGDEVREGYATDDAVVVVMAVDRELQDVHRIITCFRYAPNEGRGDEERRRKLRRYLHRKKLRARYTAAGWGEREP